MSFILTTKGSNIPAISPPGSEVPEKAPAHEWVDEHQAKARCEEANKDAAELGIKTRYEVKAV